jgi:hypothetical protein
VGIETFGVKLIKDKIEDADILCLGFPDIITTQLPYKNPTIRERQEQHGGGYCIDTNEFFERLGARSVRYIDVNCFHGVEEIIDLNYPHDLGQYDLIIDPGTLEHCFNIGQAWMNAANAVRKGGYIYHNNPITMVNHGFWSFNPTGYHDFYTQNGFECEMYIQHEKNVYNATGDIIRRNFESETMSQVIAQRLNIQPLIYPTQSKYLSK